MKKDGSILKIRLTSGNTISINMDEDNIEKSMLSISMMINEIAYSCLEHAFEFAVSYATKQLEPSTKHPTNLSDLINLIVSKESKNIVMQIENNNDFFTWFLSKLVLGEVNYYINSAFLNSIEDLPSA